MMAVIIFHFKNMSKFITLKIIDGCGDKIRMMATHKIKRIYRFLKADETTNCTYRVHVNYGYGFANWGEYETKTDAREALRAFMQEDF